MQPTPQILDNLTRQIVDAVGPLQIILFGSAARGEMGPDSDLDVWVVMPDGAHRRHTAQQLYRAIRGVQVPFDLIVATRGDLEKHKTDPGLICRTILAQGKILYAARVD